MSKKQRQEYLQALTAYWKVLRDGGFRIRDCHRRMDLFVMRWFVLHAEKP